MKKISKILDDIENLINDDIRKREAIFIAEIDTITSSFENIMNTYIDNFDKSIDLFNKIDDEYKDSENKEVVLNVLDKHINKIEKFIYYFIDEENLFIKRLDKFVNKENTEQ